MLLSFSWSTLYLTPAVAEDEESEDDDEKEPSLLDLLVGRLLTLHKAKDKSVRLVSRVVILYFGNYIAHCQSKILILNMRVKIEGLPLRGELAT